VEEREPDIHFDYKQTENSTHFFMYFKYWVLTVHADIQRGRIQCCESAEK